MFKLLKPSTHNHMKPKIVIIVAGAQHSRAIGTADNQLPWPRLKKDMSHFRSITLGNPVIMGRVTFETMEIVDGVVKPLPDRQNIVITRNPEYAVPANVRIAHSLEDAILQATELGTGTICIIGGQQIYRAALDIADEIYYSRIELDVEGTTTFPLIPTRFNLQNEEKMKQPDVKFPDGSVRTVSFQIQHWVRR